MSRISDLLAYPSQHCRFDSTAYFDPRYATADEVRAYNRDREERNRHRAAVLRRFAGRIKSDGELIPGRYYGTRLLISAAGEIDYIPGQHAPVEIWHAIEAYLEATN
jgi:hypothetical protein